jgi:hypothetical protein
MKWEQRCDVSSKQLQQVGHTPCGRCSASPHSSNLLDWHVDPLRGCLRLGLLGCDAVWPLVIRRYFSRLWRRYVPPKRRPLQEPLDVTSQKTAFFND